ncbi:hypothetical protein ON010_g190 [Phytophthora cinnamomi]|nr:hypothetical protein ON010_g190 [Phytophthora cinnamomi]
MLGCTSVEYTSSRASVYCPCSPIRRKAAKRTFSRRSASVDDSTDDEESAVPPTLWPEPTKVNTVSALRAITSQAATPRTGKRGVDEVGASWGAVCQARRRVGVAHGGLVRHVRRHKAAEERAQSASAYELQFLARAIHVQNGQGRPTSAKGRVVLGEQVVGVSLEVGAQRVGQSMGLLEAALEEAHVHRLAELGPCRQSETRQTRSNCITEHLLLALLSTGRLSGARGEDAGAARVRKLVAGDLDAAVEDAQAQRCVARA